MNRGEFVTDSVAALASASSIVPLCFFHSSSAEGGTGWGRRLTLDTRPTSLTFDTA
jgi:hypothetical protein